MLCVLSPAKKLSTAHHCPLPLTTPRCLDEASALAGIMLDYSPQQLSSLMGISDKLAQLNVARYQAWQPQIDKQTQAAAFTFDGDSYVGLHASDLNVTQLKQLQDSVRILSGLYGLLRPLDGIYPYRLEMGSKLPNPRGTNLYSYWKDSITRLLQADLLKQNTDCLINLASKEYASAIDTAALDARVITPRFLDAKDGKEPKMYQLYVKRARGMMARYIAVRQPQSLVELLAFDAQGYHFTQELSSPDQPTFVRIH